MKETLIVILSIIQMNLLAQLPTTLNGNTNLSKCQKILTAANEFEFQALNFIVGNDYSEWTINKRVSSGKIEYLKAAEMYSKADSMNCTKNDEIRLKIVNCLCQAENFEKAEEILMPLLKESRFSTSFFTHYFMITNRKSQISELKENGFIRAHCGNDVLYSSESEINYTRNIVDNSKQLYHKQKFKLLLEYIKHSKIQIHWSEKKILDELNTELAQMIIKSLNQTYTIMQILEEYERCINSTKYKIEKENKAGTLTQYAILDFYDLDLWKDVNQISDEIHQNSSTKIRSNSTKIENDILYTTILKTN